VPSRDLRSQLAAEFRGEFTLRRIGAVKGALKPTVEELKGRDIDWAKMASADVVVALPNSISPVHFDPRTAPSPDLFDLVIIDEAHHAPAKTWRAILDYFTSARAVLLTATPRRSDGKQLPGSHAFHYPLRLAIADGIYQAIDPFLLPVDEDASLEDRDEMIASEVIRLAQLAEHRSSVILIRGASIERAGKLQLLYARLGLETVVLHSAVPTAQRESIVDDWRSGSTRAVITVDMLAEGIDVPNLRIVGYHDKHKAVLSTMQFIGRLARVNSQFPQRSALVTALDADIYPSIQTAVRELYAEDADWVEVLPKLIDDQVREHKLDVEYLQAFIDSPPILSLLALSPLARATIFEAREGSKYIPAYVSGELPDTLATGARIGGQTVMYAGVNEARTTLLMVTTALDTPKWYRGDAGLTTPKYDLHLFTWHKSAVTTQRDLLFVNTRDLKMSRAVREVLDSGGSLRNGSPSRIQDAFDSLERYGVSSVGVRNTFAGTPGTPAYSMFSGSGVERGLRDVDTASKALGHAMAQVETGDGITTAGMSSSKGKYWETRYLSLRQHDTFSSGLASRYWHPHAAASGPLLPDVARGVRTDAFPSAEVLFAELNVALVTGGWKLSDGRAIDQFEIDLDRSVARTGDQLALAITDPKTGGGAVWQGYQDVEGVFHTTSQLSDLQKGFGLSLTFEDALDQFSPTIYFLNGNTVHGGMTYQPVSTSSTLPNITYDSWDWTGVDIRVESKKPTRTDTIHDEVERRLTIPARAGIDRWVLNNDGSGEIADHIVIELGSAGRPRVELWHSKYSVSTTPAARVDDLQVVTQQAVKSRRHITDRDFWKRLGRRLDGQESPAIHVISGDVDKLKAICGLDADRSAESLAEHPPTMEARVVIVQPGLSQSILVSKLSAGDQSASQIREFLTVLHNSVQGLAGVELIGSN
jgi:hypothetical protein